jgi:hypothetical protein
MVPTTDSVLFFRMPETFIWHYQLQLLHNFVLFLHRLLSKLRRVWKETRPSVRGPWISCSWFSKMRTWNSVQNLLTALKDQSFGNVLKKLFSVNIPVFSFRWTNQFWLHCFSSSASFLFCFRFFVYRSDILVCVRSLAHVASSLLFRVRNVIPFFPPLYPVAQRAEGVATRICAPLSLNWCPCSPACKYSFVLSFLPEQIPLEFPEFDNNTQGTLLPVTGTFILLFFADWKYFVCNCVLKL